MSGKTALIYGAGINGLFSALELYQAGYSVTVREAADSIGAGSSWAGAGMLAPINPNDYPSVVNEIAQASVTDYLQLYPQLVNATGIDWELKKTGRFILNAEMTGREQLLIAYPNINHASGAHYWDSLYVLRNPRFLKSLYKYLVQLGVKFEFGNPLTNLKSQHADITVLCTGAYTEKLLPQLSIKPVKGQLLRLQAKQKNTLQHTLVEGGHYMLPRADGSIIVGATMEQQGFDQRPTETAYTQLLSWATQLLPALKNADILAQWSGLRPGSPQGIPLIDQLPQHKNVYVNTGQFRNGLAMAPQSAKILRQRITGETLVADNWLNATSFVNYTNLL